MTSLTRAEIKSFDLNRLGSKGPTKRYLVTGATGFLAGHFLFFRLNGPGHFYCMTRDPSPSLGKCRIQDRLRVCAEAYNFPFHGDLENLTAVTGNISAPGLGMPAEQREMLEKANLDEIWHFAANLRYEKRYTKEIENDNVEGTRRMLELAEAIGVKRFVYVSTAYTAGKASGTIPEELHSIESDFSNAYELSKCKAEHLATEECARMGIDCRILRPSIVVGPSTTYKSGGSDSGFYGFCGQAYRLRNLVRQSAIPLSIKADPDNALNCVPVDHFVRDLVFLDERDFPGGPIYHSTATSEAPIGPWITMLSGHLGLDEIKLVPGSHVPQTPLEGMMHRATSFYASYLSHRKTFARSLPFPTGMSSADMDEYLRVYIRELERPAGESVFRSSVVASKDGTPIQAYSAGKDGAPPLLLINAYGISSDIWVPLAARLTKTHRVITWESRFVPGLNVEFTPERCSIEAHVDDLDAVLAHYRVETCDAIAWCTGAQVALAYATVNPQRLRSLTLVSGSYSLAANIEQSEFHHNLLRLMKEARNRPERAELYCKIIFGAHLASREASRDQDTEERLLRTFDVVDPSLVHLTNAPFRTAEALYRYSHMITRHFEHAPFSKASDSGIRKLVVLGEKDRMTHPQTTRVLFQELTNAELFPLPEGDHYSLYHDEALFERIETFLAQPSS